MSKFHIKSQKIEKKIKKYFWVTPPLFTPNRVKKRSKTGSKWKISKKGRRNMKIGHKITKYTKKNKKNLLTLFTPKRVKNRSKTGSKWKISKKGLRNMKIGHKITKNRKKN